MAKSSNHGPSRNTGASGKSSGGGGINTRPHVRTPIKAGPPNTKIISPAAASRQGLSQGDHVTEGGTVKRPYDPLVAGTRPQVPSGNQVALNAAGSKAGPGAGRILHGQSGSQGQHGPANPGNPIPTPGGSGPGSMGFPNPGFRK